MKIVLVDVAAKYIHTGLAIRYLYQCCVNTFKNTVILEKTINEPIDNILSDIYREKPDIVGFSCYIWNIDTIMQVCRTIKKILPEVRIVLGGPEVSYDSEAVLTICNDIDYIISGEGENSLPQLIKAIKNNTGFSSIIGLYYRDKGRVISAAPAKEYDLNNLPITYDENTLANTENRIIYYECSRGCPYRCSYCLSGLAGKVRYLPFERIKQDLYTLAVTRKVKQIKFVDRTFNHNKEFTMKIFAYLKSLDTDTNFHFEMRADLLDEDIIYMLSDLPQGRFQFEIGVQSTNKDTLKAINRPHNWERLKANVEAVKSLGNIHQHLDLIAGLPFEDYASFAKSFNDVYILQPEMLQLGFLKLIKGSTLWLNRDKYGFKYRNYPPYEVLSTDWLSYDDMLLLKDIEHVLELFYNSGNFFYTLNYSVNKESGFDFYQSLALYFRRLNLFKQKHSLERLFELLHGFLINELGQSNLVVTELLKLDFLRHFKHRKLPVFLEHIEVSNYKSWVFGLLKNNKIRALLPSHQRDLVDRNIIKFTHFEVFRVNPLLDKTHIISSNRTIILFYYDSVKKDWHHRKAQAFSLNDYFNG